MTCNRATRKPTQQKEWNSTSRKISFHRSITNTQNNEKMSETKIGTTVVKKGLAQMLKGGVIVSLVVFKILN
jgi:hypothetical protein